MPYHPRNEQEAIVYSVAKNHLPQPVGSKTFLCIPEIAKTFGNDEDKVVELLASMEESGAFVGRNGTWHIAMPAEVEVKTVTSSDGIDFHVYEDIHQLIVGLSMVDYARVFVLVTGPSDFAEFVERAHRFSEAIAYQHSDDYELVESIPFFRLNKTGFSAWDNSNPSDQGLISVIRPNLTRVKMATPTGFIVGPGGSNKDLMTAIEHYSGVIVKARKDDEALRAQAEVRREVVGQQQFFDPPLKSARKPAAPQGHPRLSDSLRLSPEGEAAAMESLPYQVMVGEAARNLHASFDCDGYEAISGCGYCLTCEEGATEAIRAASSAIEAYIAGRLGSG